MNNNLDSDMGKSLLFFALSVLSTYFIEVTFQNFSLI